MNQPKDCQLQIGVHTYDVSRELKEVLSRVMEDKDKKYNALYKILQEERGRADAEIRKYKAQNKEIVK